MKKESEEFDRRKEFANRLAKINIEPSIQQIQPKKAKVKEGEVQLNVHIDEKLLKKLKLKGVAEDKSLRDMITEAINMYLIDNK